ncbi:MAG TPA: protein kinase [Pyrinomonadaceae bacterium]|nr:protein kinase [Pyrinomonadaceae bacterium]
MELESISRYKILEKLGSGGMGDVYLAEDTKLGRKVALKLLAQELTQNRDRLSRFDQEAFAASGLNHPNILTIYELGDEGGRHFIATEYIEGQTLRKRLQTTPMEIVEVLDVAIQIAGALEEAHAASIIHRDIKPENVMIRRNGHVKVLDFGLAKLMERPEPELTDTEAVTRALVQTDAGMVLGTSQYMSPEQARGKPVDARTDIWSLGVVLYEMATGRAPFSGETKTDVIVAIAKNEPPPLVRYAPNAPAEFEWIVLKALRKEVDERYQTVKEFESDLKKLKQRIEFQSELERSMGPDHYSTAMRTLADTEIHGSLQPLSSHLTAAPSITGQVQSAAPTRASNAEYIVSEIKRHKRSAAAVAIAGVVVSALVIAYFAFWRTRTVLTDKDTILLADFVNTTGDQVFDGTLKQALAVQLGQSPFLDILPESRVRESLKYMQMSQDTRITRDVAKDICVRQGIKAMLLGSISVVGAHYVVSLEALNSQTGDTIAGEQFEVDGKEQVLKSLGPAASRLREKLGESLNTIKKFDAPIEQVTTSSLEALRQYSQGVEQHSKADYSHAILFYRKAIEIDPYFAIAHARLALCYNNNRQFELAREEYKRAYELRDRVSERESFVIAANYYGGVTGEWDAQINELETWKGMYPRDGEPLNLLCNRYTLVGPFERAVTEGRAALDLNPRDARPYVNLAVAFIGLNRFDEANRILREAKDKKLETLNMHQRLFQLAFLQGDTPAMQEQLEWARANSKPEEALAWEAQAATFSGELALADQLSNRIVEMNRTGDAKEPMAQALVVNAVRDAALGSCDRAIKQAKQSLDLSRERETLINAASAYATCGQASLAQSLIDELDKQWPVDTLLHTTSIPIIRAQMDLARGNAASAVQLLEGARKYEAYGEFWPQYLRGQAYLKQNNGAQAATEFKTILDHRGWYPVSPLYPLAQLGFARAAAMNSDRPAARKAYQDFLALWKDADTSLPAWVAARSEYEKLK